MIENTINNNEAYLLLNQHLYTLKKINTIGGDDSCNIQISVPTVEPRHARIELKGQKYIIKDMNSKKGVYVNETKIIEAELQNGDFILIGDIEFTFSHTAIILEKKKVLISKNQKWQESLKSLSLIAKNDFPVILVGESGTGKDIISRQIHAESERCDEPFISVNCSALSPQLIESELFGHIKGSFTGAEADRKGAFMAAHKGTLFLDEIGDLPLNLQPKLLRALENQEVKPVGSDICKKTNVRIIAATHKLLHKLVEEGGFRQDLYYRLNVLQLNPPSLKNRMEDFDDLFYQFAKKFRIRFDYNAILELKKYEWPGNIRELKNFIIKSSIIYKGQTVNSEMVKILFHSTPLSTKNVLDKNKVNELNGNSLIKQNELDLICKALINSKGNQRKAALSLGMPTSTMNDRIKKYKIDLNKIKDNFYHNGSDINIISA